MIISIEGLDGSGKETTAKEIQKALMKKITNGELVDGLTKVEVISFPWYDSPSGKFIQSILKGEISNLLPEWRKPTFIAELFTINRYEYFKDHKLTDDTIYIMDRYIHSNIMYQGVGYSVTDLFNLGNTFFNTDMQYNIPEPDMSIFLDVDYSTLRSRLEARAAAKAGVENDTYEADSFLKSVYHVTQTLSLMREIINSNENLEVNKRTFFPDIKYKPGDKTPEVVGEELTDIIVTKFNLNKNNN